MFVGWNMAIGWMKNKLDRSRHVTEEAQLQSTWDYNYAYEQLSKPSDPDLTDGTA